MTQYRVLSHPVEHQIDIKRSRFLCLVQRVESEDEARHIIAERRRAFYDARHTCSAFLLGPTRMISRSSDDKEPAGTAGMPMLEALSRHRQAPDLSDVVAVVTRWFGGVLLGAGGLTRAYSQAVSEALNTAAFVRRSLVREYVTHLDYAVAGRVEGLIRAAGLLVADVAHRSDAVSLTVTLDSSNAPDKAVAQLTDVSGGQANWQPGQCYWADVV